MDTEWIWKVLRTADGTLWFQTDTSLRYRLPGEKTIRELPAAAHYPHIAPWDMNFDGQGNLWVCGEWRGGGLARRDTKGVWRIWNRTLAGEPLAFASRVVRRQRGGVWVATRNKLLIFDGKTLSELAAPYPLHQASTISSIYEDSRGRLWAGSDAGLAVLEADGGWRLLNDRPGFDNRHVYFISEDWKGTIWVNTARGVYSFLDDGRMQSLTPNDGLADWETNGNGFYSDARGEIWIGTVNGLSQYNPANRSLNSEPPRLVIENVRLPARSLEFPKKLELAWKERSLVFNIAVLSYRNHNRTAYRARLDGMEYVWLPLQHI
jgi:hypothetical protein